MYPLPLLLAAALLQAAPPPAAPDSLAWVALSAGDVGTCALRADHSVWCWGGFTWDRSLELDARQRVVRPQCGMYYCRMTPARVPLAGPAVGIEGNCAILESGAVQCWVNEIAAIRQAANLRVTSYANGTEYSCLVADDGGVYCWGLSGDGQLGIGSNTSERQDPCTRPCRMQATRALGTQTFRSVDAGEDFTCALTADSAAFCWGMGRSGQVGDGAGRSRNAPTAVAGGHRFMAIATGAAHACGLATDGQLYCWGRGREGQLGNDSLADRREPTLVSGDRRYRDVRAGGNTTCAVATDGSAWCWGRGNKGQTGGGAVVERVAAPAALEGGMAFHSMVVAGEHACGIAADQRAVYCWGKGGQGQLGNGARADSPRPVPVTMP